MDLVRSVERNPCIVSIYGLTRCGKSFTSNCLLNALLSPNPIEDVLTYVKSTMEEWRENKPAGTYAPPKLCHPFSVSHDTTTSHTKGIAQFPPQDVALVLKNGLALSFLDTEGGGEKDESYRFQLLSGPLAVSEVVMFLTTTSPAAQME